MMKTHSYNMSKTKQERIRLKSDVNENLQRKIKFGSQHSMKLTVHFQ